MIEHREAKTARVFPPCLSVCMTRYEGDPRIQTLKEGLRAAGIEDEEIKLLQAITQYAGRETRDTDLFSNKNFFAVAKNSIQRGLKVRTSRHIKKSLPFS